MLLKKGPVVIASVFGTGFGLLALFKDRINGRRVSKELKAEKKTIIVTGANDGIGLETVAELAERGATVIMACRDMKACEKEREQIVLTSGNRYVYCRPCDLASFESIRQFAKTFKAEHAKLDVLVNNAAVMRCPKSLTQDGIETQLGVNHMGHFLLTNLLLDDLKKAPAGRVVVVSCDSYRSGKLHHDDFNSDKSYDPGEAYNQSKLANMLFMNELSAKLLGTSVTVNAVDPGIVDTNITRHITSKGFVHYLYYPFFWGFIRSPWYGCQTLLHVALDDSLDQVTGKCFRDFKEKDISEEGRNLELARWLWSVSEKWTKLSA